MSRPPETGARNKSLPVAASMVLLGVCQQSDSPSHTHRWAGKSTFLRQSPKGSLRVRAITWLRGQGDCALRGGPSLWVHGPSPEKGGGGGAEGFTHLKTIIHSDLSSH